MLRRFWPWFLIFVFPSACFSTQTPDLRASKTLLREREHRAWRALNRASEFRDILHLSARSRCEETQPPQALATPDPPSVSASMGMRVRVSFIIGTDGRVHSPLILQSAGAAGDRNVLRTVRTWRYRPATCNGVPTEAEGKVEFSRR